MHGNTCSVGGVKTRLVADIVSEIRSFFEVAQAEGLHGGGMHLEMTGGHVTECLGGVGRVEETDLGRRYLTHCDPRLNEDQAIGVAKEVAELIAGRAERRSDAA